MLRLLSAEHVDALSDPQTWTDNPFAARDSRRDRARFQLTRTLAWMALVMVLVGGSAAWGLSALERKIGSVPWYLGGDKFTSLMIVVSGIHVWFVASTAQRGTLLMFSQEASRNTLMHLLMLPVSRFQIVLETAIYPWFAAMRVALALLPFYVFIASIDRISWADLLLLYLVFAISAVSFPMLRRPVLGDTALTSLQLPNKQQSGSTATAFTGPSNRQQQSGGNPTGAWITLAFLLPMLSILCAFASGRGVTGMYGILHPYLPDSLIELMPSSMLSWPLLMARTLVTPLDWFGYSVAPAVFALPLMVAYRYFQVVRTAEYLEVGTYRDLALVPTYLLRRRFESAVRFVQLISVTGYLWKWLVVNGGLGFYPGARMVQTPGLPSFVYVLLFLLAWIVMVRSSLLASWRRSEALPRLRLASRHLTIARTVKYLLEPSAYLAVYYIACCIASHTAPFPREIINLTGKMLALTVSAGLLSFGADSVLGSVAAIARLALPVAAFIGFNNYHIAAARTLAYFSPTLGLLSVLHPTSQGLGPFFQGLEWRHWISTGGSVGLALTVIGMMRFAKRPHQDVELRLDPTRYGLEVFQDETAAALDPTQKEDTPFVRGLVRLMQRIGDNAITTREIRTRLRGKLDTISIRNMVMVAVVLSFSLYEGAPQIANAVGGWLSASLYGSILYSSVALIANIVACWLIALAVYCGVAGFVAVRTFSVERDKSTLGFLLLTPMSNASIVRGKATGVLLSSAVIPIAIAVWTLLVSVLMSPLIGPRAITGWALVVSGAGLCYTAVGMVSIALGAFISKWNVTPGCWSFFVVISTQIVINGGRFALKYVADMLADYGIQGIQLFFVWSALCCLIIGLSYLVAVYSVFRMRRGDLAFAASKRDN